MNKVIQTKMIAWLRGLVWAAMIAGCAWASAQSYVASQGGYAAAGQYQAMVGHYGSLSAHYNAVALGAGDGVTLLQGEGAEGAQNSQPPAKDDLFAGTEVFAKGASDITEITMDPDSLDLVGGPDEHKAHNMVLNVVRTYTYDKPGMYNMADVDAIRNKLNTGDWHCSVHVRDLKNGSGSDVCNKHRTDGMRETAIIEVEPKQLTFIHTIRKGGGPGSSELGFFPMLPGLGPMTMMAMTDPEAFADMETGMHGMILNLNPNLMLQMNGLKDLRVHPFDESQMKELQENLKTLRVHPMDQKQMQDLQKQMKDFNKEFYKDKGTFAPVAPTPPTPETQQTPITPETAPSPATPQTAPAPAPEPPQ